MGSKRPKSQNEFGALLGLKIDSRFQLLCFVSNGCRPASSFKNSDTSLTWKRSWMASRTLGKSSKKIRPGWYMSHTIHVWYLCLHFVDYCGKYIKLCCTYIHRWHGCGFLQVHLHFPQKRYKNDTLPERNIVFPVNNKGFHPI